MKKFVFTHGVRLGSLFLALAITTPYAHATELSPNLDDPDILDPGFPVPQAPTGVPSFRPPPGTIRDTAEIRFYIFEFEWSGLCDDCEGGIGDGLFQPVTGQLVLSKLAPGSSLEPSSFVSFSYGGSSILDPFELKVDDTDSPFRLDTFSGTLDASGKVQEDFLLIGYSSKLDPGSTPSDANFLLNISISGNWKMSTGILPYSDDEGINGGQFRRVPEPTPLALLAVGLGALMLTLRRLNDRRSATPVSILPLPA